MRLNFRSHILRKREIEMKEYKPVQDQLALEQGKRVLQSVISHPSPQQKRPCPSCDSPCSCSGSKTCACECSYECPSLPYKLSLDPVRYPVEKEIVPLVFAINSLHACPSYWSCEGHENSNGELIKPPRVNFYSSSTVLPSLITECLSVLYFKKTVKYRWRVISAGMTEDLHAQYVIEPDVEPGLKNELFLLQKDVKSIADNLFAGVKEKARFKLRSIDK